MPVTSRYGRVTKEMRMSRTPSDMVSTLAPLGTASMIAAHPTAKTKRESDIIPTSGRKMLRSIGGTLILFLGV